MTSTDKTIGETDSAPINSLARCDNGMVSVGLNADEFVTDTYKSSIDQGVHRDFTDDWAATSPTAS